MKRSPRRSIGWKCDFWKEKRVIKRGFRLGTECSWCCHIAQLVLNCFGFQFHPSVSPISCRAFLLTSLRNKAEIQGDGGGELCSAVEPVPDSLRTGSHLGLGEEVAWSCRGRRASPENLWRSLLSFCFSQIARACWMWSPLRTSRTTCCRPWSSSSSWTTQSPHSCLPRCSRRWQTSGRSSQSMCSYCMWSRRRRRTWAFTPCSRRSTRIYISRKVLPADVFLLSIALLFWGKKIWHLGNLLWKKHFKNKRF